MSITNKFNRHYVIFLVVTVALNLNASLEKFNFYVTNNLVELISGPKYMYLFYFSFIKNNSENFVLYISNIIWNIWTHDIIKKQSFLNWSIKIMLFRPSLLWHSNVEIECLEEVNQLSTVTKKHVCRNFYILLVVLLKRIIK